MRTAEWVWHREDLTHRAVYRGFHLVVTHRAHWSVTDEHGVIRAEGDAFSPVRGRMAAEGVVRFNQI